MDGTKEKSPMAMTKADIVEALYEKVGFSKKEAADLVEMVFDTIKGTLSQGNKIKISGFGNFVVREKRSRVGRNPQTGETIEISARRVLTFRPSQVLRAEVNSSLEGKPIDPNTVHHGSEDDDDDAE
jgi:integration host factor subunit alpha